MLCIVYQEHAKSCKNVVPKIGQEASERANNLQKIKEFIVY